MKLVDNLWIRRYTYSDHRVSESCDISPTMVVLAPSDLLANKSPNAEFLQRLKFQERRSDDLGPATKPFI